MLGTGWNACVEVPERGQIIDILPLSNSVAEMMAWAGSWAEQVGSYDSVPDVLRVEASRIEKMAQLHSVGHTNACPTVCTPLRARTQR